MVFVQVELRTLDGLVKDSTQCAPNGYYFVPVYDKVCFARSCPSSLFLLYHFHPCFHKSFFFSFSPQCYRIFYVVKLVTIPELSMSTITTFRDIAGYSDSTDSGARRVVF